MDVRKKKVFRMWTGYSLVHRPFVKTALNISTSYEVCVNIQVYRVLPPNPRSSKRPL